MQRTYYAQFRRLLELDRRIRAGEYPNALSFSHEWDVAQKTIQRDLDYLRYSLGAPMEYDRFKKGFYYTDKNWFLPAFNVQEGELQALLLAKHSVAAYKGTPLAKELDHLCNKVVESLPKQLPFRPELVFTRFSFVSPAAKVVKPEIWKTMTSALLTQQSVHIHYHSLNAGQSTERTIDPYHIANLHGEWYVFAWCHLKKRLQQFGLPQIQQATLTATGFELPKNFDPQKLLANTFRRQVLGDQVYEVTLRFDRSVADKVMQRVWQPKQKTKKLKNGDIELGFPAVGLFEVTPWVLAWGGKVKVIGPKELKEIVRQEIRSMQKNL